MISCILLYFLFISSIFDLVLSSAFSSPLHLPPIGHVHTSIPLPSLPLSSAGHSFLPHAADRYPRAECRRGHALPAGGAPGWTGWGGGQGALPPANLWVWEAGLDCAGQLVDPHGGRHQMIGLFCCGSALEEVKCMFECLHVTLTFLLFIFCIIVVFMYLCSKFRLFLYAFILRRLCSSQ